jgi:hypothetical protein
MLDGFEIPGVLASMGEASITLAGFAAVFKAFRGERDPDGYSWVRLSIVIEGSLILAFACYLPALLWAAGFSEALSWQLSSLLILIWAVPKQNAPTIQIFRRGSPFPVLFFVAGPLGLAASMASLLSISTLSPLSPYATHLLASILLLANVATIFVAQFRVERTGAEETSADT